MLEGRGEQLGIAVVFGTFFPADGDQLAVGSCGARVCDSWLLAEAPRTQAKVVALDRVRSTLGDSIQRARCLFSLADVRVTETRRLAGTARQLRPRRGARVADNAPPQAWCRAAACGSPFLSSSISVPIPSRNACSLRPAGTTRAAGMAAAHRPGCHTQRAGR